MITGWSRSELGFRRARWETAASQDDCAMGGAPGSQRKMGNHLASERRKIDRLRRARGFFASAHC